MPLETMDFQKLAHQIQQGRKEFADLVVTGRATDGSTLASLKFTHCRLEALSGGLHIASTFEDCDFARCDLFGNSQSTFVNSVLTNVTFTDCDLTNAQIESTPITNCKFVRSRCDGMRLHNCPLAHVSIELCSLNKAVLDLHKVEELRLHATALADARVHNVPQESWTISEPLNMAGANFTNCSFNGLSLNEFILYRAEFTNCDLENVNLSGADLQSAKMTHCNLRRALLSDVKVDSTTRFERCDVAEARIERFTLESLDRYGGLTIGQRMTLHVTDGALLLKQAYTGFWQWLHVLALLLFLSPYAWLLFIDGIRSATQCPAGRTCMSLLDRLVSFIYTGGAMNGVADIPRLMMFGFLLLYNLLRAVLLYKAKTLELQELASGVPASFAWGGKWKRLYQIAKIGFWFNIALAVIHTLLFLDRAVVIRS